MATARKSRTAATIQSVLRVRRFILFSQQENVSITLPPLTALHGVLIHTKVEDAA
jgi:hypothetical protein